ncbi:helix-turn-helix transcriptional regulator [Arthrobacter sp. GMC3]|uniref:ArsR/SmtB family transcription factor n=1 Tax=Arthrobacter sp. GMC3 TaxID=2058894 RepID=UPI000CE40AB3|nr:metalloregulator ArsR/SmtB family transcription factor [Arthrobacter sp. GMC3]
MVVEEVFAVIAEGTRRDILASLAKEHKAVGQLVEELGVSQPTVSKHLRVLREAGVVTMRAQGQKRFYSINTAPLALVSEWLHGLGAGFTDSAEAVVATVPAASVPQQAAPVRTPAVNPRTAVVPAPPAQDAVVRELVPAVAGRPAEATVVAHSVESDGTVQQQITRSVGRAANKAADLLANLPSFRRRKD